MRMLPTALAAAALCLSGIPTTALADTGPVEINSWGDFAIKTADVPNGCSVLSIYADERSVEVTCPNQQAFVVGFQISDDFTASCDTKSGKYVCTVKKR